MENTEVLSVNMTNAVFLRLVDMFVAFEQIPNADFSKDISESLVDLRLALARCIYRVASSSE